MALTNNSEFNSLGGGTFGYGGYGGGFGFGGGLGNIGAIGLVGISDLFNRDHGRGKGCNDGAPGANELATLAAIANAKDQTVAEGRAAAAAFSIVNDNVKDGNYAAAIQAERNTAQLASQAQAFAIQADRRADELATQATANTAAILARINQTEVDNLRDQLHESRRGRDRGDLEIQIQNTNTAVAAQFQQQQQLQLQRELDDHRRRFDNREIEINNINTNTAVAAQAQAQAIRDLDRDHRWNAKFDTLFSQNAKVAQDIINIGSGVVGASQTSNPTNVNSKLNQ